MKLPQKLCQFALARVAFHNSLPLMPTSVVYTIAAYHGNGFLCLNACFICHVQSTSHCFAVLTAESAYGRCCIVTSRRRLKALCVLLLAADEKVMDAVSRVIALCSGPMACGGKVRGAAGSVQLLKVLAGSIDEEWIVAMF
jgi:hypothetical protein